MTKSRRNKSGSSKQGGGKAGTGKEAPAPAPVIFSVRVTPKSSATRVSEEPNAPGQAPRYKVHVTVPPEDGKANEAMLKALAAHLGVAPSRLRLIGGQTSREKRVQFD